MKLTSETIEVSIQELETLVDDARKQPLSEENHRKLKGAIQTLAELARMLADQETTLSQLRALLLKAATTEKTEKTGKTLKRAGIEPSGKAGKDKKAGKKKRKGHGRKPARAYAGARKVNVAHPTLKPGDGCAECGKGKLYPLKEPGVRVRIVGQAPIQASVYELERMRCNLCGDVLETPAPEGVGEDKYDETSASIEVTFCFGILPRTVALPNGGDAEVWERSSVPPAGRAAGKSGDSVAGFDAVGDGGGGGGVDRAGARRVDPAGGARGGAAQRRYVSEDPAEEAGNQRGS